jgi:fatty acyl-CoA reductase
MEDDVLNTLTPFLIHPRPNTYTYTKAMAEFLLVKEAGNIPCCIVRPSIVGPSWREPMPVSLTAAHQNSNIDVLCITGMG